MHAMKSENLIVDIIHKGLDKHINPQTEQKRTDKIIAVSQQG